jgi:LacI family transcriptional regulator
VVNDHPNVRDTVRERVWQVIQDTGYQPHAAARSLVTRRTRIVGVIIPEAVNILFTDPFFAHLLCGVTQTCNTQRYHLMLSLFTDAAGPKEMYRRVVGSGYMDGVVVTSMRVDDPLIGRLQDDHIPFVIVGRHPNNGVHYVNVDNVAAARMAVEHLIRLGHQRIATITGPLNMTSGQDRLAGYRQALTAHQLPVDETLILEGDFTETGGTMAARRLLPRSPTAIFAASDVMAVGALKALREAGLQVPQDVALVGFDDVPLASAVEPPLTTVRQPIERMGSMAADLLLDLLENPPEEEAPAHRIILPGELAIRASCGALI